MEASKGAVLFARTQLNRVNPKELFLWNLTRLRASWSWYMDNKGLNQRKYLRFVASCGTCLERKWTPHTSEEIPLLHTEEMTPWNLTWLRASWSWYMDNKGLNQRKYLRFVASCGTSVERKWTPHTSEEMTPPPHIRGNDPSSTHQRKWFPDVHLHA